MSKNTGNTKFRKVNVDEFDEDNYKVWGDIHALLHLAGIGVVRDDFIGLWV